MKEKKEPGRFSIKFNPSDPTHKAAIDLLNQQSPRGKAQFIANAVLHYIHCPETPDIMQPMTANRVSIEAVVLDILQQQQITSGGHSDTHLLSTSAPPQSILSSPHIAGNKSSSDETKLDTASLSAISDTLAAFRRH